MTSMFTPAENRWLGGAAAQGAARGYRRRHGPPIADVCIIVEGAYPYVSGGVSAWVHGLIRRQPDLRFRVVAILPKPPPPAAKYPAPPNLRALHHLYLSEVHRKLRWHLPRSFRQAEF